MSEELFKEARGNLAFSQRLIDEMVQSQQQAMMPQEAPVSPKTAPQAPQEASYAGETAPQAESAPQEPKEAGMLSTIMDEIRALFGGGEKRAQEAKERESKISKELKGLKEEVRKIVEE